MPRKSTVAPASAESGRSKRTLKWFAPLIAFLAVLGMAAPAWGHHSPFVFADKEEVTLTGTVKAFEYTNPHAWLRLMVPDSSGESVQWNIETGAPTVLKKAGIKRTTLQAGETVTVRAHPFSKARSEADAWLVDITKADGSMFKVG